MKTTMTFLIALFFGILSINAQNDMTSLGTSGGCQDGTAAAYSKSKIAFNSIMNNSSINQEYKSAYQDAYYACKRGTEAQISNKWKFSKDSQGNQKNWKTYVLFGKLK